jgi:hypothetical protein
MMCAVTGKLGVFGGVERQESTVISTLKKQANDYDKIRDSGFIGCNSFFYQRGQKSLSRRFFTILF